MATLRSPIGTMAGVHVNHDDMNAQAQRLGQTKNELEAKLQEIQSQIQQLISSGFVTDSSSAAFGEAYETDARIQARAQSSGIMASRTRKARTRRRHDGWSSMSLKPPGRRRGRLP